MTDSVSRTSAVSIFEAIRRYNRESLFRALDDLASQNNLSDASDERQECSKADWALVESLEPRIGRKPKN